MGEVSYLPLIEDMTWSYSRLGSFKDCPYRFFLRYISKCKDEPQFYAEYGSFIHRLIEQYYRGEITKQEMQTVFLSDFSTEVKGKRPNKDIVKKYIQKGSEYLGSFEPFPYKMVDVEMKVEFHIGGSPFVGYIDFLGIDEEGNYIVIDNKSRDLKPRSKRKTPTVKDKELDQMLRQLYLYSSAVKEKYGKFPTKLCFNCFKAGVFIEEPFNEEAYDEAIHWAEKTIELIKGTEDFYPMQDYFACNFLCGVNEECLYYEEMKREMRRKWRK